jgi:hypothetical protein
MFVVEIDMDIDTGTAVEIAVQHSGIVMKKMVYEISVLYPVVN